MSDEPDPHTEPDPTESIWQPLDGSAPPAPPVPGQPVPGQPLSFKKPEPRPTAFPLGGASGAGATEATSAPPLQGQPGSSVYVLAGWGPRLGAYLLDSIIFSLALLVITIPSGLAFGMTVEESAIFFTGSLELPSSATGGAAPWVIFGLQIFLQATLPSIFLARWNGQTPGKRIAGLRVVTEDGSPMTLGKALTRELLCKTLLVGGATLVTFGIAFLANYLWPLFDAQNRAGHDALAKTRVVVAPRTDVLA